jgi:MarR family transcriptional regulator for hemolysin
MPTRSELEAAIATGLRPISGAWQRLADVVLGSLDVSNSQGWALVQLVRLGPDCRQADLARAIGITEASLVRTLHQLEHLGYVARAPNPDDRRSNRLVLTEKGSAIAHGIETRLIALRRDLLAGLSDEELAAAARVLGQAAARIAERQVGERRGRA